jgi:hypothetical protein
MQIFVNVAYTSNFTVYAIKIETNDATYGGKSKMIENEETCAGYPKSKREHGNYERMDF